MTYRTTFALDKATKKRLKRLAEHWKVSQSEVVRRALSQAEEQAAAIKRDPDEILNELHASGHGLAREAAEKYLVEVRENRARWRGE